MPTHPFRASDHAEDGDAESPTAPEPRPSRRRPLIVAAIGLSALLATPLLLDGDDPSSREAGPSTETTVALERIAFTAQNALEVRATRRVGTTSSPGLTVPAPTTTTTVPPTTAPPTTAPPTTAPPTTAPPTTAPPTTAPPTTAPPTTAPPTTAPPTTAPPVTAPPTTAPPVTAPPAAPISGGGVWDQLAQCESGGNWAINTGNGYYGGLQFSAGSWQAVGGTGLPHQHSRETQIAMGERLRAAQGWGAWPACSRKLGLR